jgi:hypothetical protein
MKILLKGFLIFLMAAINGNQTGWDEQVEIYHEKIQDAIFSKYHAFEIGLKNGSIFSSGGFSNVGPITFVEADEKILGDFERNYGSKKKNTDCFFNFALDSKFLSKHLESTGKTKTFKEFLFESLYLKNVRALKFFKVDLEGAEEFILEDLFDCVDTNNSFLLIKFNVDQWRSLSIDSLRDYTPFFDFYADGKITEDVIGLLKKEPRAILGVQPKRQSRFVKKNPTVMIIGYNQVTFIKQMVKQLEKYTKDIVIIDNKSFFKPLLDFYNGAYPYTLLRMGKNFGHRVWEQALFKKIVNSRFFLTDPDLKFHPKLPASFLQDFYKIQEELQAKRVGFALDISAPDIKENITVCGLTVKKWESRFWKDRVSSKLMPHLELYSADIDTTFCLIDRTLSSNPVRVAGDYTCKHIPWHENFHLTLEPGEYEAYMKQNRSTSWMANN